MTDREALLEISAAMASAIAARDVQTLAGFLAPGFVHRAPGGPSSERAAFLEEIAGIPGEIAFVRIETLEVDVAADGALVTGVQHAQVTVDGTVYDDRRAFVDFFVRVQGAWRLQVAVDLP